MTEPTVALRRADAAEIDRVASLLAANDLPCEDVRADRECFFLAFADGAADTDSRDDDRFVGSGGVETYGSCGLLRSVVVRESARGRGLGAALCDELERYAREEDVETLYLLTTTAAAFFRRRGYERVARQDAPSSIRETSEFAELCPDSAVCMCKDVG